MYKTDIVFCPFSAPIGSDSYSIDLFRAPAKQGVSSLISYKLNQITFFTYRNNTCSCRNSLLVQNRLLDPVCTSCHICGMKSD